MTSKQLKKLMEKQWKSKGVEAPLQPARWMIGATGRTTTLLPDNDPYLPDEYYSVPAYPVHAR